MHREGQRAEHKRDTDRQRPRSDPRRPRVPRQQEQGRADDECVHHAEQAQKCPHPDDAVVERHDHENLQQSEGGQHSRSDEHDLRRTVLDGLDAHRRIPLGQQPAQVGHQMGPGDEHHQGDEEQAPCASRTDPHGPGNLRRTWDLNGSGRRGAHGELGALGAHTSCRRWRRPARGVRPASRRGCTHDWHDIPCSEDLPSDPRAASEHWARPRCTHQGTPSPPGNRGHQAVDCRGDEAEHQPPEQ